MNITWFSWKDQTHPEAGGAERVSQNIARRLAQEGHSVTFIVGGYKGCTKESYLHNIHTVRLGNKYSVYIHAIKYYLQHLNNSTDLIIEEINTAPFFTFLYARKKRYLFFHQLCREIWFYQFPFPGNIVGFVAEWVYLNLLRHHKVICVSKSTQSDLLRFGFQKKNISIITEGIELRPLRSLNVNKYSSPTVLSFGTIRSMKRTLDQIKAFEIAKNSLYDLKLVIAGTYQGSYGKKILKYIQNSHYSSSITYYAHVSESKKIQLMRKSHLLLMTSVKEGWGLVVTEANSQGTPAIGYNVDGLRDSIKHNVTGILASQNTPQKLAQSIILTLKNKSKYDRLRVNAYNESLKHTFMKSYKDFHSVIFSK